MVILLKYWKKMNKELIKTFKSAIFAGIFISIGGLAFLTMGNIIGPILFTFGLISVVHYKLFLYTGTVGFLELIGINKATLNNWAAILTIIIGNAIGCLIVASLAQYGGFTFTIFADNIVNSRLSQPLIEVMVRAIGCGVIMTTAVQFARDNKFLPLLFGVPLFIYCGFYHSIADTFYYLMSTLKPTLTMIYTLFTTYVGNYFGCSLYKLLLTKK